MRKRQPQLNTPVITFLLEEMRRKQFFIVNIEANFFHPFCKYLIRVENFWRPTDGPRVISVGAA
jgi:hypothetical protein